MRKFLYWFFILLVLVIWLLPDIIIQMLGCSLQEELKKAFQEHEVQSSFLGFGLLLLYSGIDILKRKKVKIENITNREVMYTIDGRKALWFGYISVILGLIASLWSLLFWLKHIIPVIWS